jgi:glutamate-1-semialdehyde 2,1-aminomutase
VVTFRTGYSGAQGLAGVEPDITYFGKAFGGGFPVGAIGGKDRFMEIIDNSGDPTGLSQSGTFSGNSFTLAAGLANLRALTPELFEQFDGLRERLHAGMARVFGSAGIPAQILSEGAAAAFYLSDKPVRDHRSMVEGPDHELTGRINMALLLKGYSLRGGIQFTISQPMGTEHIDGVVEALEQVLAEA